MNTMMEFVLHFDRKVGYPHGILSIVLMVILVIVSGCLLQSLQKHSGNERSMEAKQKVRHRLLLMALSMIRLPQISAAIDKSKTLAMGTVSWKQVEEIGKLNLNLTKFRAALPSLDDDDRWKRVVTTIIERLKQQEEGSLLLAVAVLAHHASGGPDMSHTTDVWKDDSNLDVIAYQILESCKTFSW